jgi:(p)ppGpp synthase/HD superfamily hydrolase
LLARAFAFALDIHGDQRRKGSGALYITHPMAVAATVGEFGGAETEMAAALLHDCVEDGGGMDTLEAIRAEFGDAVADIVWGCSDAHEHPKPPWQKRKESFIENLKSASPLIKRVVAADKLHNARALQALLAESGAETWRDFRGGRDGTLWYYEAIAAALAHHWREPILDCLEQEVARLTAAAKTV